MSSKIILDENLFLLLEAEEEPPPEPAPPEVPPRGQSLQSNSSIRKHQLKIEINGDQKHELFVPQEEQLGKNKKKLLIKSIIIYTHQT